MREFHILIVNKASIFILEKYLCTEIINFFKANFLLKDHILSLNVQFIAIGVVIIRVMCHKKLLRLFFQVAIL